MTSKEAKLLRKLKEKLTHVNIESSDIQTQQDMVFALSKGFMSDDTIPDKKFYCLCSLQETEDDRRNALIYQPTYIACAIMMNVICQYPELFENETIKTTLYGGLNGCIQSKVLACGCEKIKDFLETMDIFAQGHAMEFICHYPDFCPAFHDAFLQAVQYLRNYIGKDNIMNPSAHTSYTEEGRQIFSRLFPLASDEALLFVYGSLMKGQAAHQLMENCTYRGRYFLPDYALYDLGSYPGIQYKMGEAVVGEVYVIKKKLFERLDDYESEGSLYERKLLTVRSDKEKIQANVYVYLRDLSLAMMQRNMWGTQDETPVWYACYGSNLSEERFRCYMEGKSYRKNKKSNNKGGFRDQTEWQQTALITQTGELYFGNKSKTWYRKGVAFFDPSAEGKTYMKLYRIKWSQLIDLQIREGSSPQWYGRIVCLGIKDGYPVYTLTSEEHRPVNLPSKSYLTLIAKELKKQFALSDKEMISYIFDLIVRSKPDTEQQGDCT